jgi:hypothetical protein
MPLPTGADGAALAREVGFLGAMKDMREPSMLDTDAWRAAQVMLEQYGPLARQRACARVDELLARGDPTGAAIWQMIERAIEELTRSRRPGERLN